MIYVYLIVGFIFLVKGADLLVEGATAIARRMKVSNLVIGLTIVAFGTSAPELFVNVTSSIKGNTGLAIGNVLGSNIANILLVLGVCSIFYPLKAGKGTVWKEIPFCLFAAVLLGILANSHIFFKNQFPGLTRVDGIVFLFFFLIFMIYSFRIANKSDTDTIIPEGEHSVRKSVIFFIIGIVGLSLGGKLIVDSAVKIALAFGMSEMLIGLTIVAIGTTLPELAASIAAVRKRNVDLAVGNIVGSNILNIFFVLGISCLIRPLPNIAGGNISFIVMIVSSLALFIVMFTGKKHVLEKWEGSVFVIIYFLYLVFLITNKAG